MKKGIPFELIDWEDIDKEEIVNYNGIVITQEQNFNDIKIRMIEYFPGYESDHWCELGHIIHCINGEAVLFHKSGSKNVISAGMSFVVSVGLSSHRISSEEGAKLVVIDGGFLS